MDAPALRLLMVVACTTKVLALKTPGQRVCTERPGTQVAAPGRTRRDLMLELSPDGQAGRSRALHGMALASRADAGAKAPRKRGGNWEVRV